MTSVFAGHYQGDLRDLGGNALVGALIEVRLAGTAVAATLYNNAVEIADAGDEDSLGNSHVPAAAGQGLPGVDLGAALSFYADADAEYDIVGTSGTDILGPFRVRVKADRREPPGAGTVTEAMLAFTVGSQADVDAEAAARVAGDAAEAAARAAGDAAEATARAAAVAAEATARAAAIAALSGTYGRKTPPFRRPGLLVPAGTRIRGVNLVPRSITNPDGWGHAWGDRWATEGMEFFNQIDLAKAAGANCVRAVGGANVTRSGSTQATYIVRQRQVAQYCLDKGMLYYPVGMGDLVPSTEVAEVATVIAAQVVALSEYPNVIGMDLFQEWMNWVGSFANQAAVLSQGVVPIYNAVKAANTTMPVTFSQTFTGAAPAETASINPYVDYHDVHIYSTTAPSLIEGMNSLAAWGKPVIVGEAGVHVTGMIESARVTHKARLRLALERPDLSGFCYWAIVDFENGESDNHWGLYDTNHVARTNDIDYLRTLPTTDGAQRILIPAAADLTLNAATGTFAPWSGTLNTLPTAFLTLRPAVPLRAKITQTIDVESVAAGQFYAGRVLLDGVPAADYPPGVGVGTTSDAGPSGYTGTMVDGPSLVPSPFSGFGNAIAFDGAADGINFGSVVGVGPGAYTVECKFQRTRVGVDETLVAKWKASGYDFLLDITANKLRCGARTASLPLISGTTDVTVGLHTAAMTYDGTNLRLFLDGTLQGTLNIGAGHVAPNAFSFLSVGRLEPGVVAGDAPFQGTIDEIRLSNIARYTAAYTPAVAPFTSDANTLFLAHLDTITYPSPLARVGGTVGRLTAQMTQEVYLTAGVAHTIVPEVARVTGSDVAGVLRKEGTRLNIEWQPA